MSGGFEQSLTKGHFGEGLVKSILKSKGYIVYSVENEGSHPFDLLVVNMTTGKTFLADVKTIPRRNKYPDNGLKHDDYKKYSDWKKKSGLDFWIFFVDEMLGSIYGNELSKLSVRSYDKKVNKSYPMVYIDKYYSYNSMIYFHLNSMINIGVISEIDSLYLRELAQRRHGYEHL